MIDERKGPDAPDSRSSSPRPTPPAEGRIGAEIAAVLEELHAALDAQARRRDALAVAASVGPAPKRRG